MENFDESEVQEIGLDDPNYPELLRSIRKPPKTFRMRGSLPPDMKTIAISGSRETTEQALQTAYRIGKMLAEHGYTIITGLAEGCDEAAVEGVLPQAEMLLVSFRGDLKHSQLTQRNYLKKSSLQGGTVISEYADNLSKVFPRHYLRRNEIIIRLSEKTIIIAADERSGSSATANRAMKQGREVIITPHVKAKVEGATIVKNLGELKDALGIAREGLKK